MFYCFDLTNHIACSVRVYRTQHLVERMSANLLFLTIASKSKKCARLTLPRMNCSVPAEDFFISLFRRRLFPVSVCLNVNQQSSRIVFCCITKT